MLDVLFALGLLLSPATQLRYGDSPVGPGEICLLVWIILSLGREVARLGPPLTPALSRLFIFWSLFAIAQSLGTLTLYVIGGEHDPRWFLHDVVAYTLLAAASCLSVIGPYARPRLDRVAWLLCALGTPLLALQFANAWELISISSVDPWYWDQLRGWSANPHQLAMLCTGLALLSLHLAETATSLGRRIAAVACAILPIHAGLLTKADSFSVVVVAAGPIFVALKLRAWLVSSEARITLRSAFAWIIVLALPMVFVSAALLRSSIATEAESFAGVMSRENYEHTEEKTELRLDLWRQAISKGIGSGMLGLGPGPHLEIPAVLLAARSGGGYQPQHIEHPQPGFAPNFEAHNTFLDLFVQGGLIAVLSFIWLVATALSIPYRAQLAGLPTLLCGLGIYGFATLIIREPIFWFAIALCLVAGRQSAGHRQFGTGSNAMRLMWSPNRTA
jgi:hypothetical protein